MITYLYDVLVDMLHPVRARPGDVLVVRPGHERPICVVRRIGERWRLVRIGPPNFGALILSEDNGVIALSYPADCLSSTSSWTSTPGPPAWRTNQPAQRDRQGTHRRTSQSGPADPDLSDGSLPFPSRKSRDLTLLASRPVRVGKGRHAHEDAGAETPMGSYAKRNGVQRDAPTRDSKRGAVRDVLALPSSNSECIP